MSLPVLRLLTLAACLAATAPPARAEDAAREALAAALLARFPELRRVELRALSPVPARIEIPADLAPERRVRVWALDAAADGGAKRTASWWAVKAYGPALVARRALRAGERVRPGDVETGERDLAGAVSSTLTADPGLARSRWRATRFVRAGDALRRADLEPAPEIERGQTVRVSVVSDSFTIETTGIARQEGRLGDRIGIENPASAERYFAQVAGDGRATIREAQP